jgi:hypothetical protein
MFAWLNGNKDTLKLMGSVIVFAYTTYMAQFSKTARIKNISSNTDVLAKLTEIIKEHKKLGINVDEEAISAKEYLGNILNETHKLFKNNPDINLNGQLLGIKEVKKELLEQPLQIDESIGNTDKLE